MRTRLWVLLLILFLSVPCFAQQSRIDSIAVDEDKGELVLHGDFQNSSSAVVLVDSVLLPVSLVTDTLLRATIPVSGKGSCGPVKVVIAGMESNSRLITYFHFQYHYEFNNLRYGVGSVIADTVHIRADLNSVHYGYANLTCTKFSRFYHYRNCNNNISDTNGILHVLIDYRQGYFQYEIYPINNGCIVNAVGAYIPFDDNYGILTRIPRIGCIYDCDGVGPIALTDFPPSTSSVQESPSTLNIFQAHLSSDPIMSNADLIVTLQNPKKVQIQILDILSHIISSDEKMLQAGINKLPINSSALPSGMYICRLQAGGEVVSVRFVKE